MPYKFQVLLLLTVALLQSCQTASLDEYHITGPAEAYPLPHDPGDVPPEAELFTHVR